MNDTPRSQVAINPEDRRALLTVLLTAVAASFMSDQIAVLCLVIGGMWSAMVVPEVQTWINDLCLRIDERIRTVTSIRGWERVGRPLTYLGLTLSIVAVSLS